MATAAVYAATLNLEADREIARWRPVVQWILAVPHLVVVDALSTLRGILSLISAVAVVFTGRIPRPLFDAITMTYRYEWRALSYAAFLTDEYPPFEFMPAAADDGHHKDTGLAIAYPEHLNRWKPLYKWVLAIPHYVVCLALALASVVTILWSGVAVVVTGTYPARSQRFLVGAYRYGLRVQAYVGPLTDQYPPFRLAA
jgi:roadblock/LC7 domain-containing protein